MEKNILVLGLGNILLSDEGAGVRAVELLQERYQASQEVEMLDGGTLGMELLPLFDHRTHIFILDAAKSGKPPGTASRTPLQGRGRLMRTRTSPHQIGLLDVLALAETGDGPPAQTVLYGIEPGSLGAGLELSAAVETGIDEALCLLLDDLAALGIRLAPRSAPDEATEPAQSTTTSFPRAATT